MKKLFLLFAATVANAFASPAYADSAVPWQISFQDSATPVMEGIVDLHHEIFFFVILTFSFVIYLLFRILGLFNSNKNEWSFVLPNSTAIEIIWTIIPIAILILIAMPSFSLLYAQDEIIDPAITVKAIGHQWYWSYEYSDYATSDGGSLTFDSYMVPESELSVGELRLLEVDERVVLPVNTHVRVIITAADVLHSWAVPSLGIKMDAVPGRLNQIGLFMNREGVFYGQCSEICGENHGFMPIVVEAVSLDKYIEWLAESASE